MKRSSRFILLCALIALVPLGACTGALWGGSALGLHELNIFQNPDVNLRAKNYAAADYMIQQAATFVRKDRDVVRLMPLVNFRDPKTPAQIGRLISDQIGARWTQLGYKIDATHVAQPAEVIASSSAEAQYILNGHYVEDRPHLNISLRLVDVKTNQSVGAFDYMMTTNREIREMAKPKPQIMLIK